MEVAALADSISGILSRVTDRADEAARLFGLGPVTSALPVTGGLSNDMWRVTTDRGAFAVKVMRVNADRPDFEANVEAAFLVERAAFDKGVPCPEPVPLSDGRCLARVHGAWVRVHRWVEGSPPAPGERSADAAALLAAIHAGAPPSVAALDDEPWDAEGWASLADQTGMPADLSAALRGAAVALAGVETETSAPGRLDVHVLSHGDLDPKNTLVVQGTLMAVDWDAAGPRSQVREAVAVALDWTRDPHDFRATINAYRDARGVDVPAEPWVFGGWVSALGGWLVHHAMTRAGTDQGRHEIVSTMQRLTALSADLPRYVAALA